MINRKKLTISKKTEQAQGNLIIWEWESFGNPTKLLEINNQEFYTTERLTEMQTKLFHVRNIKKNFKK